MSTADEYSECAAECMRLAVNQPQDRRRWLAMAARWTALAASAAKTETQPPPQNRTIESGAGATGMARVSKSQTEIETILLGFLRSSPGCSEARNVSIELLDSRENGANWTVSAVDHGPAPVQACEDAIDRIVPLVQGHFDLKVGHDLPPETAEATA
jgi:hypothetical protein